MRCIGFWKVLDMAKSNRGINAMKETGAAITVNANNFDGFFLENSQ
jgi:hypothetical protein